MSLARKIAVNTILQVVGKGIGLVLSLVTAAFLLRYLGLTGNGQYGTVLAFLMIFAVISDFGLYILLLKKLSRDDDSARRNVNNIFTMGLVSGIFFLGLAPLAGAFMPYPGIVKMGILIASGFYLFVALTHLLSAIFMRFLSTYWIVLGDFLGKVSNLLLILLCIFLKMDLKWILAATVIGASLQFLVSFLASRRYFKIRLAFDFTIWKDLLREAWPVALSIVFALIYFKADIIILSLFRPEAEVGMYYAPFKLLEVIITFPAMFAGLMIPLLTKAWHERLLDDYRHMLQNAFDFLVISAVPMVGGCLVLAEPIMEILGGKAFIVSAPILKILIFATAAMFPDILFGYLVVSLNQQRKMLWMYAIIAVTSLVLYFALIPRFSYWAAAGVTVYSQMVTVLAAYVICYRASGVGVNLNVFFKSLLATAIMACVLKVTERYSLPLSVTFGALSYLAVLFLSGGISKQQIREIIAMRAK